MATGYYSSTREYFLQCLGCEGALTLAVDPWLQQVRFTCPRHEFEAVFPEVHHAVIDDLIDSLKILMINGTLRRFFIPDHDSKPSKGPRQLSLFEDGLRPHGRKPLSVPLVCARCSSALVLTVKESRHRIAIGCPIDHDWQEVKFMPHTLMDLLIENAETSFIQKTRPEEVGRRNPYER